MSIHVGESEHAPAFAEERAKTLLANTQLRRNVRRATDIIRGKRARVVAEMPDWEQLRELRQANQNQVLAISTAIWNNSKPTAPKPAATSTGPTTPMKPTASSSTSSKPMASRRSHQSQNHDLGRDPAQRSARCAPASRPYETDLADLIIQLGNDKPSHIVVPALHKNKSEIRDLFIEKMGLKDLGHAPEDLAAAARAYLRERFLRVPVGFSGANFAIAETGSVCVVESEGNGRMCVTLPKVLITMLGIEKIIPDLRRSRSLPATSAALRHRRAHEPLQLHLDRRHRRRRPAGIPRGAAR